MLRPVSCLCAAWTQPLGGITPRTRRHATAASSGQGKRLHSRGGTQGRWGLPDCRQGSLKGCGGSGGNFQPHPGGGTMVPFVRQATTQTPWRAPWQWPNNVAGDEPKQMVPVTWKPHLRCAPIDQLFGKIGLWWVMYFFG